MEELGNEIVQSNATCIIGNYGERSYIMNMLRCLLEIHINMIEFVTLHLGVALSCLSYFTHLYILLMSGMFIYIQ